MLSRALLVWTSVFLCLVWSGCERGDPQAARIEAATSRALARWRMKMADRLTREQWREFEAALQDVRLRVMAEREASGSDAVEQAMCGRIDGRTLREVLMLGYESKLKRLDPIRVELQRAVGGNELLVPRDPESEKHLEGFRARQQERLAALDAEIEEAEQRLVQLDPGAWAVEVEKRKRERTRTQAASGLTREEARAEFAELVNGQRSAALLKYGDRPVRIEREGARLPETERAEFMKRRTDAEKRGHVLIAVRLEGRWRFYEGPAESPKFSRAVAAVLTEADRREMDEMWWNLQAELWARREAHLEKEKEPEQQKQP